MAGTPAQAPVYEIEAEDFEYVHDGGRYQLARVLKPQGDGPFPAMIEIHGGAWCSSNRLQNLAVMEQLAKSGIVIALLDFRMPPVAPYPASVADINYAVRWLKFHAEEFSSRPEMVGAIGNSSGAHLAMLVGMRPKDPRYSQIPLPYDDAESVDASLRFAVLCWPVIDPLARYHYAKSLQQQGKSSPELDGVLPQHDAYWQTEAAMAEGNPVLALERGERAELPPVLYLQGTHDQFHPRVDLDRFVAAYGKAGGHLELELFEGEDHAFLRNPSSPSVVPQAFAKIQEFIHNQTR